MDEAPTPPSASASIGPGWLVVALVSGAVVWCAVQGVSGRENFGDAVSWAYFAALFATAGLLGWMARLTAGGTALLGLCLWSVQAPAYLLYPNPAGELGNLFPIAMVLLAIVSSPAVAIAVVAGWGARRVHGGARGGPPASAAGSPPPAP